MKINKLNDIAKAGLCLGCGLCTLNNEKGDKVELKYSSQLGHVIPDKNNNHSLNAQNGFDACPGKGYNINSLAQKYGFAKNFKIELGYYQQLNVVTSKNKDVLKKASSSGIMTLIAKYLLAEKLVDRVIVTKFNYTDKGPIAKPFIAENYEDLQKGQGSKYCPVDFSELLEELKKNQGMFTSVFIGTPCQIAALRNIQKNQVDLGIRYYIGNFCGGYKSYNNLERLITVHKLKISDVEYFRFRGGGQPGSMLIKTKNKKAQVTYPEYVKMTGYLKLKRCHFCVDATAELADFACGDAWLPKYQKEVEPTSIVISRNKQASGILNKMVEKNIINSWEISAEEIIQSQLGNIKSKKYRQQSRIKFYRLIGKAVPEITEGFLPEKKPKLMLELNIYFRHHLKLFFEKIGLYYLLYYKKTGIQRLALRFIRKK